MYTLKNVEPFIPDLKEQANKIACITLKVKDALEASMLTDGLMVELLYAGLNRFETTSLDASWKVFWRGLFKTEDCSFAMRRFKPFT